MRSVKWIVIAAVALAAAPASAQVDEKAVNVNIGGGYTFTANSEARDKIGDGYNIVFGLTVNPTRKFGVQFEYAFHGLGEKQVKLPVSIIPSGSGVDSNFFADANFHYLDFNAVLKPMGGSGSKASPYFVAGLGYYFRSVDVTTPAVGYVPGFCDPWWYVCYPGGFVPVDKVVGSRSSNDWGMNFGAGVDFKLGSGAAVYIETRYHYIWGPEVTDSTGKSYGKANGKFLPITFGIRF
jgi:opacity protein-like surface antigen